MTIFDPEKEPVHISELVSLEPQALTGDHSDPARANEVHELSLASEVADLHGLRVEAIEDHDAGILSPEDADRAIPGLTASLLDAQADLYQVREVKRDADGSS